MHICYNTIMRLFKDKLFCILAIFGIVFFFVYSFLPISQLVWQNQSQVLGIKFNTPDEVINYYFSVQYTKTNELYYFAQDHVAGRNRQQPDMNRWNCR